MKQLKRTFSDLSTEELLKLAEGSEVLEPFEVLCIDRTVDDFVKRSGIKPGTIRVPCWFLLAAYNLVTEKPISRTRFFKDFASLGLTKKRTKGSLARTCYLGIYSLLA